MKQCLQLAALCALLAVAVADKRFTSFTLQRQETEDLSPPTPPPSSGATPAQGGDAGGPYPPSGWKPQGQRLELPPRPPQQQWGAPQPQQQYGAPPKQPQQQYGAPPKQPQQQYGAPRPQVPAEPEPTEAPATESPDQVAVVNNKLRQQLRLQRVAVQRLRQQVRDQQSQLQQLQQLQQLREVDARQGQLQLQQQQRHPQQQYLEETHPVHHGSNGRLQRVQFSATPSSTSFFKQSVPQELQQLQPEDQLQGPQGVSTADAPPTFVARLQFMDVPPIDSPVFSFSGSAPLVRVA